MRVWEAYILARSVARVKSMSNNHMPVMIPNSIGNIKVYIPNKMLFELFCLNVLRSISNPAWNIIYKIPTLPKSSKLASLDSMFNPWGPNSVPARINPMMWGILNRLRIGAHKMITITNRNMAIGSVKGKVGIKSSMYFMSLLFEVENWWTWFLPLIFDFSTIKCKVSDFFLNNQ